MGFLDAIRGKTKPAEAKLDALFRLPSASLTLTTSDEYQLVTKAAVCMSPGAANTFDSAFAETLKLISDQNLKEPPQIENDSFGYRWIIFNGTALDDLVTKAHMINSTIESAGWGPQLLCSVFKFDVTSNVNTTSSHLYLVYLFKRGSFYPFLPLDGEKRDNEGELHLKAILSGDLPMEEDLTKWFPIWNMPL